MEGNRIEGMSITQNAAELGGKAFEVQYRGRKVSAPPMPTFRDSQRIAGCYFLFIAALGLGITWYSLARQCDMEEHHCSENTVIGTITGIGLFSIGIWGVREIKKERIGHH